MSREEEAALHLAWLKNRIEALSDLPPQFSVCAYTHNRTPHVVFANGALKPEGDPFAPPGPVGDMAEATLRAVREYAETIPKPHLLTWRREPSLEEQGGKLNLSLRLALETDKFGGNQ